MTNFLQSEDTSRLKFDPKFYIEDINGRWVDFSDRSGGRGGVNALHKMGSITHSIEKDYGAFVTKIQDIQLDNREGFFDRLFPLTLRTVDVAYQAIFDTTKGYKRSVLRGRRCKVAVQIRLLQNDMITVAHYGSMDVIQEEILGVFWIDDVVPDVSGNKISLKLISPDHRLQQKDASGVKDGYSNHQYKSVSFLLEEILRSEFTEEGGSTPSSYNIDRSAFLDTIDGSLAVSVLGRPPRWDGSIWRNDSLHTRAICFANGKLYLGCDDQLWEYNPTNGVYKLIHDFNLAGYYIKDILIIPPDWPTGFKLIIMLWQDEYWGAKATAQARTGWNFKMYTWTVGSATPPVLVSQSNPKLVSLQYILRASGHIWYDPSYSNNIGVTGDAFYPEAGESVLIPFAQHAQFINNTKTTPGTWEHRYILTEISQDAPILGSVPYTDSDGLGYDGHGSYYDGGADPSIPDLGFDELIFPVFQKLMLSTQSRYVPSGSEHPYGCPLIYYVGQRPCIMFSSYPHGGKKYVYFFRLKYDSVHGVNYVSSPNAFAIGIKWVEMVVYATDGSHTTSSVDFPMPWTMPICMIKNYGENRAYCFWVLTPDDTAYAFAGISSIDLTVLTTFPFTDTDYLFSVETSDHIYWTVIGGSAYSNNSGSGLDKFLLCLFNRLTGSYALARTTKNILLGGGRTLYTDATILKTSNMPFTSFAADEVDNCVYVFGTGEGKIYKDTGSVLTTLNQAPVVNDEFGILSNLTVNQEHTAGDPDIYGVSSPGCQLESYRTYLAGKYDLFRLSSKLGDVVENADFDGLTKMKSIQLLSQMRDGLSFFDRNGFFNYITRSYTVGTADYIIGDYLSVSISKFGIIPIKSIQLGYGYKNVFNVIKAKSYVTIFEPPEQNAFTYLERSSEKTSDGESSQELPFIEYFIEQKDTATKTVLCYCIEGGTAIDGISRWKYSIIQNEIEAQLVSDATSSATTFSLASVFGGDDTSDGIHTGDFVTIINPDTGAYITRGIGAVTESLNRITINSAFGIALKKGAILKIQRAFKINSGYGKSEWSDEGVTYVSSNKAIGVTVISVASVANLSISTVVRFGDSPYEYRITEIGTPNATDITIERERGSGAGLVEAIIANDLVYAFYSPKAVDGSEIGTSRIFITWSAGSGIAEKDYTRTFIMGDRFVIKCPGISLVEDSKSLQVVIDSTSAEEHGREEYMVDNRFVSRDVAKELIKRILYYYADPRFAVKVIIPLTPYIDMVTDGSLTKVKIHDPNVFISSAENSEMFHLLGIQHNINQATTTLTLRGIEAY